MVYTNLTQFTHQLVKYRGAKLHKTLGNNLKSSSSCKVNFFSSQTHEITNQSDPLVNYNLFESDNTLKSAIKVFFNNTNSANNSLENANDTLSNAGVLCGSREFQDHATLAERNKPTLTQFDHQGRRIDHVEYHPSYHALMTANLSTGGAGYGFQHGDHVTRGALMYLFNQLEPGHCCPVVMTAAAVPVLKKFEYFANWTERIQIMKYDSRNLPVDQKIGATIGMSMTEKQGGSDVRTNTTVAVPVNNSHVEPGKEFVLRGHKWFTSAPMSDGFLTLAQTIPNGTNNSSIGLSCFLVPRWVPRTGERNIGLKVMRLKDKIGDRSNASSEIEYDGAVGLLVGEPGKGIKTIIQMVQSTRLDCTLGSAGNMRKALALALKHVSTRTAFEKRLIDQPLMKVLLTDLSLEANAHCIFSIYLSSLFQACEDNPTDTTKRELFRVAVSIGKYFVTKRQTPFTAECLEALGGNGFVEDWPMARLYRQAPLNSVWEGSGNVIALDVLKAQKSLPLVLLEISKAKGVYSDFDAYVVELESLLKLLSASDTNDVQRFARQLVDTLALAYEASLMILHSNPVFAHAFVQSRLPPRSSGFAGSFGSFVFSDEVCNHVLEYNNTY